MYVCRVYLLHVHRSALLYILYVYICIYIHIIPLREFIGIWLASENIIIIITQYSTVVNHMRSIIAHGKTQFAGPSG